MVKLIALAILSTILLTEAIPLPGGGYYRHKGYYKHYRPQAHVYHHSHGGKHGYSAGHQGWYKGQWKPVVPAPAPMASGHGVPAPTPMGPAVVVPGPPPMEIAPEAPVAPAIDVRTADLGDVVDVAVGAGAFTTLVQVVSDLGLVETLKGVEAVTIFAPSDEAFAKLPEGTLESLTPEQAKAIVARHVVAGITVMAADVATGDVATFGGETVGLVKTEEGGVQVVYNGQTVNVVTADVGASNGVIHVIDNVIVGAPEAPAAKAAPEVPEVEAAPETPVAEVGDVVDVAVGAGSFTTLVKIVSDLGLVETLKGVEAATIFAPSDDAFAKLPEGTLESLTPEQAKAIIARHVVAGATVMAADVTTGDVETFGGETVGLVKTEEGGVQVVYNGQTVNVVTADVGASNGVIHVIDNVIVGAPEPEAPAVEVAPKAVPEAPAAVPELEAPVAEVGDVVDVAVGAGAFTTLVKIVSDLGLVETLKGVEAVTIFAPTDEAFAKLPEGTLESLTPEQAKAIVARHVVAGATVMAADVATGDVETFGGETVGLVKTEEGGVQVVYNGQTVNVVTADVGASNGVIHIIDNVIVGAPETAPEPVPEAPAAEPAPEAPVAKVAEVGDLVDVAVENGAFTTLVKLVSDLGLVETLKGVEAATIFAPSDDAFAKLPEGTLESLTPEQAKAIVSRHVVAGATVYAADVATGSVGTFGGENIDLIKTEDGGVQVSYNGNAVNVVAADVKASNGVIHVIDAVIL